MSTLAAQHDVRDIASASPAFGHTPCEIRIWRVGSAKCTKVCEIIFSFAAVVDGVFLVGSDSSQSQCTEHGLLQR